MCPALQADVYNWDFSNPADYFVAGSASVGIGSAYVAAWAEDEASVFARLNTQTYHLSIADIIGGGYKVYGMNNPPGTIYGSLYLSPTGGPGSSVLVLLSPMSWSGAGGSYDYTFDLKTHADYRTRPPGGSWSAYDPAKSGTFEQVKNMIMGTSYGGDYAAFWGPQIGMSGTSNTTFSVSNISLSTKSAAWKVATAHGVNQFDISDDGTELGYHKQPRNAGGWYWYQNNGAAPDVLATGGLGPNGWRDGSRTFAATNVAVGKALKDIKLVFDFKHSLGGYPTINYFMTDGNGKYGIFAPTSLGITVVGGITVLDADWSRMTVDLTSPSIPDSTVVAVYEHNGFTNVYGDPFTTMTWGDIKNYTIAGMYDYQRSPALGWGAWGEAFSDMNIAGNPTLTNGYGIALIWGDTVGNTTYATQTRMVRDPVITFDSADYVGLFEDAQIEPNHLYLEPTPASIYIKPTETCVINMNVENLQQPVDAVQAFLAFDSAYFSGAPGAVNVAPGGGDWTNLIWNVWNTDGDLDVAVGVRFDLVGGTDADATTAIITLTPTGTEGTTNMVFRPDGATDVEKTWFAVTGGGLISPIKSDSVDVVIDGTAPHDVAISADPASWTNVNTVNLIFTAEDALAGIDYYELSIDGGAPFTATSIYALDVSGMSDGTHSAQVTAYDKAGNSASASTNFYLDKTDPGASFTATQGGANVLTGSAIATSPVTLRGGGAAPDPVAPGIIFTVTATDATAGISAVTVAVDGLGVWAGSVADDGGGVYTCPAIVSCNNPAAPPLVPCPEGMTCFVPATMVNGVHEVTVTVMDSAGNMQILTDWIYVNVNQLTIGGKSSWVKFATLSSTSYSVTRSVVFTATDSAGTVLKTWTPSLLFSNASGTAKGSDVTLTDVPANIANLSAKTAWSLRTKHLLQINPATGNAFTDAGYYYIGADYCFTLLGGDINDSNSVNVLDYSVLKGAWMSTVDLVADINGDGVVNVTDYNIMKMNWFKVGDAQ